MDYLNIFLLGGASGIILSIISMFLISANNSEKYPIGGFVPALWMITDLGIHSQIVVAGVLVMGGMSGFYLVLTFWKEIPSLSKNHEDIKNESTPIGKVNETENLYTVKGKSLAEFL